MVLKNPITLDIFVYSEEDERLEDLNLPTTQFDRENDPTQPYTFYNIDCVAPSKYQSCSIVYFGGCSVVAKVPISVLRGVIEENMSCIRLTGL